VAVEAFVSPVLLEMGIATEGASALPPATPCLGIRKVDNL